MDIPKTKKEDIVDTIGGVSVADPYRWLEDGENEQVLAWIHTQNTYTDSVLRTDDQKTIADELVRDFKVVSFSDPTVVRGRYFYFERQPDEDQNAFYVKHGLEGEPIKLIDPNGMAEGNTATIDFAATGWTGRYVAYGISVGGDEMATLRVLDVDEGKDLPEEIDRCRYASIRWLPDDSGFFYTRNPQPGEVPENEEHLHTKVFFHRLGDDVGNDELIFGEGRPKDDMIQLSLSADGAYLALRVSQKWIENDIFVYDVQKKVMSTLIKGIPSVFSLVFMKEQAILITNYRANNYRILSTPLSELFKPVDDWHELVPEREHLLGWPAVTADRILLTYLVDASSQVVIVDHHGKETGTIPLPEYSSIANISSRRTEREFFYSVTSFTFPKKTYRFDPETAEYSEYRAMDNPINPDDFETKQEWYESRDGTRVPMFIFHKKGVELNGNNPTILYGYGGFDHVMTPGFMRSNVPWMERGGVFAVANIRGGGEFGKQWHLGGIKEHKQNSYDDFIAAAEFLISKKYTDAQHLGILGGSNGGLLVSAVAVQRPELFKAVCSRVPLTDMVRFPEFGMAMRWVHEYGDPRNPDELKGILRWSPYHNVRSGTEYPNFLFMTADRDTRVDPLHARKMAALLQSVNAKHPVMVFSDFEAGHGPGKPIAKIVDAQSLVLTFFAQALGLAV